MPVSTLALGMAAAALLTAAPSSPSATIPDQVFRHAIAEQISVMADARDYRMLNEQAFEFRKLRARLSGGAWKSSIFYATIRARLSVEKNGQKCTPESQKFIDDWVRYSPHEPAAVIMKSESLLEAAFCIRGEGYADTVPAAAWPLFRQRLAEARQVLEAEKPTASRDPEWYAQMENVANAQDWTPAEFQTLVHEASERYPGYYDVYFRAVPYYLPKWHGSLEELDDFVRASTVQTKETDGIGMYARIYRYAAQREFGDNLFKDSLVSWPLMKLSMADVARRYPDPDNFGAFARLACLAKDKDETARYLKLFDAGAFPESWRSPDELARCRALALGVKPT